MQNNDKTQNQQNQGDSLQQASAPVSLFSMNMFAGALATPASLQASLQKQNLLPGSSSTQLPGLQNSATTGDNASQVQSQIAAADKNEEDEKVESQTPLLQFAPNPFMINSPFAAQNKDDADQNEESEVKQKTLLNMEEQQTLEKQEIPSTLSSLMAGSLLSLGDSAIAQESKAQAGRELLRGLQYQTYHSVDVLAPQVEQDLNLSLTTSLPTKKCHPQQQLAKSFLHAQSFATASTSAGSESNSVLAFLTASQNISLLLNQTELCEDVISQDVLTEIMPPSSAQVSSIEDFTIVQGRFLVILLQSGSRKSRPSTSDKAQQKLVVFDCTHVSNRQSPHVRFMHVIEIEPEVSSQVSEEALTLGFNRIEAVGDAIPRSVLLIGKYATTPQHGPAPLLIQFSEFETERQESISEVPFPLNPSDVSLAGKQKRVAILDVCLWDNKVAFLYEQMNTVAIYELSSLTMIFKASFKEANEQISSFYHIQVKSDESLGFFVFLETKTQTKKLQATGQTESKKVMQKVHLVELQQKEVKTSRKNIVQQRIDMFEQIDALSFGAENQKVADFVVTVAQNSSEFWLFLLNKRVSMSKRVLRLFTLKICANKRKNKSTVRFDYITETAPKVAEAKFLDQKPAYMKVIPAVTEKGETEFYTYIGFSAAQHSAVFKFSANAISGPTDLASEEDTSEADLSLDEELEITGQRKKVSKQMPQQASPPSSLQASSVVETDVAPTSPTVQYASLRDQLVNSQSPGANKELEDFMRREISQMQASAAVPTQQPSSQPSHKKQQSGNKPNDTSSISPRPQTKAKVSESADPAIISSKKGKKDKAQAQAQAAVVYKEKAAAAAKGKQSPRDQEKYLLDNFLDLTNKYKEMHEKMTQLTHQVKTQKDIQIQVEQTVKNAVKAAMPEMIKKQVEETVEPLIAKQADIIQSQINSVIVPRIEAQLRQGVFHQSTEASQTTGQESTNFVQGINGDQVRKVVQGEFRDAMQNQIVPELEKSLGRALSQIREPLNAMNKALFEQLVAAENRSDTVVRRLEWQLNQQLNSISNMQQQQHQMQQQQIQHQQNSGANQFSNFNMNNGQQQPGVHYFMSQQPQQQTQFQPSMPVPQFYPNTVTANNNSATSTTNVTGPATNANQQQVFTPVGYSQQMSQGQQSAQVMSSPSPLQAQQVKFYPTSGQQTTTNFNVSQAVDPATTIQTAEQGINFVAPSAFTVQEQTNSPHMTSQVQTVITSETVVQPQTATAHVVNKAQQKVEQDMGDLANIDLVNGNQDHNKEDKMKDELNE